MTQHRRARRRSATIDIVTAAPTPTAPRWVEPTSLLPLRWGRYRPRVLAGLALVTLGVASVQITTTYSLQFLALGCLLQAIGWTIMPSAGWRRMTVFVPAILASCLLLGGGGFAGSLAVILAAWLLVRHRPPLAFVLAIAPILLGILVSGTIPDGIEVDYNSGWVVLTAGAIVTVGCAWTARAFSAWTASRAASSTHGTISRDTGDLR